MLSTNEHNEETATLIAFRRGMAWQPRILHRSETGRNHHKDDTKPFDESL